MGGSWRGTPMELLLPSIPTMPQPPRNTTLLFTLFTTLLLLFTMVGPHWRELPMFILWSMGVRRGLLMPRLFLGILMDMLPTLMLWLHLPLLLPIQMELLSLQSPRMLLMLELHIWQLLLRLAVRRDQLMPRL